VARLYKRGRVWWTWGYYANGEKWVASTQCHDKQAAGRKALDLERQRTPVDRAEVAPLSIEQALNDVIAARVREAKSEHTVANYRRCGGHLCRVLGADKDVHELTLADLEHYIDVRRENGRGEDGKGEPTMRSTIDLELRILKSALAYATKHKRYRGTVGDIWPAEALKGAHVPHERYLTREEYVALRGELPRDRADYLTAYVMTGARRSEVWRIHAEHVHLARNTIRIKGTKTEGADRIVPIAAELRPIVERRLETCGKGPLWPEWDEWHVLDRACKRLSIEGASPNDLRRTFCSWLALANVPLLVTVKLMGHRSSKMVERVYARFGSDDLQAAISKLPAL